MVQNQAVITYLEINWWWRCPGHLRAETLWAESGKGQDQDTVEKCDEQERIRVVKATM